MGFSKKDFKNIGGFLTSNNLNEVSSALDYLGEYNESVFEFLDQLVVLFVFSDDYEVAEKAAALLSLHYSEGDLTAIEENFKFFEFIENNRPAFHVNILVPLFANFNTIRSRYEALILANDQFAEKYIDAAKEIFRQPEINDISESLLNAVVKHRPDHAEAYMHLALIQQAVYKDYDQALELFEKSIELNPENYNTHIKIGYLKECYLGRYFEAIRHYEKAADLEPSDIQSYVRLANSHYHFSKDYNKSKQYIEIVLSINPDNDQILTILACIHWKIERNFKKALEVFERGLNAGKFHSPLLTASLAEFYVEALDNLEMGKLFYIESLDTEPGNRVRFNKLKRLLENYFNDYGLIRHYFEKYLAAKPLDTDMHLEFSKFIIQYVHDPNLAKKHLGTVLKLDPDRREAQRLLGEVS